MSTCQVAAAPKLLLLWMIRACYWVASTLTRECTHEQVHCCQSCAGHDGVGLRHRRVPGFYVRGFKEALSIGTPMSPPHAPLSISNFYFPHPTPL
jgi:hypothetical protein